MTDEGIALRAAIDATESCDRRVHRAKVAALASDFAHSIEYLDLPEAGNCATFAFGLTQSEIDGSDPSGHAPKLIAGRAFIEWLIQNHLCEIEHPVQGSLALYFLEQVWQHVGVVAAPGRIVSQWGKYPIYEHAIFEVPTGYGDRVRYFEMIESMKALRLFRQYVKTITIVG